MEKLPIILQLAALCLMLTLLGSCQEEVPPTVEIDENGIVPGDPISELIVAVTTKDGSPDNIIDESSCTTVIFPITGLVDDEPRVFNALEDVQALGLLALEVEWVYPINVILSDHSEVTLFDEDELEEIQENCIEGGSDPDIECIDLTYPFTVSIFDNQTENAETRILDSDQETYNTFSDENLVIDIEFPISLTNSQSQTLQATDNDALEDIILTSANTCNEEDITEFEDELTNQLEELFTTSNWEIAVFENGGIDNTALFSGFSLQFNPDLSLLVTGPETIEGEWEVGLLDTSESINIEFDTENESFILLNGEWSITSYDTSTINLQHTDTEEGIRRLQLTSN